MYGPKHEKAPKGEGRNNMAKKSAKKAEAGKVMAVRATLALHGAAVTAAKVAGESLGALMLRGIALAIAAKRKAPKAPAKKSKPTHKSIGIAVAAADVAPEQG
jgi:hypothetical protein